MLCARLIQPKRWRTDYDNIMVSFFKGVWSTKAERSEALTSAFLNCDHVFLFFTVGGSNLFQGNARMASVADVVGKAGGEKGPVGFGGDSQAIFTVQWLKLWAGTGLWST